MPFESVWEARFFTVFYAFVLRHISSSASLAVAGRRFLAFRRPPPELLARIVHFYVGVSSQ